MGIKFLLTVAAIIVLVVGAFFTMGGIVNTDAGIPLGLYWKVDRPLAIGKIVVFCPPNQPVFQEALKQGIIKTGNCPDGFGNIKLKVAAKRKNIITINESGVYVDNVLLPLSKPLVKDMEGRMMPVATLNNYELKDSEILLMSDISEDIFDSRYFGVVDANQVESVVSPVF